MKTEIIQCADRPKVIRHGDRLVIEFTDGYGKCACEINLSQACGIADDIREVISDNINPVMAAALRPWACR